MAALVEWLVIIGSALWMLSRVLSPDAKTYLANLVGGLVRAALGIAVPLLNDVEGLLSPIASAFVQSLNANGGGLLNIFRDPAAAIARTAFTDVEAKLTSLPSYLPEDAPVAAGVAMGEAFGFGIASAGVAALYESIFPEKLNTLDGAAPMLEKLAGFEEVAKAVREPLYENAFGKGLEYHYKNLFKPEFADEADAVQWHSRRLLSEDDLREVFKYSGLKAKYESAYVASAYRSVQPRAIASLVQDVVFPEAEMTDLLQFAGLRDKDIALLIPLMRDNSVKNVRQQYLSALLIAAERGTLDDTTLDSHLDSLNFSTTAKNYVHLTVGVRRLEQLAELYRKSVTALYETLQLSDAQYVPALQAIGISSADANAHYAIDSARLKGRQLLAAEREAAREEGRVIALSVATTTAAYLSGQIDDAAMAAAIAGSGLPLTLVPAVVGHLTAQRLARRVDAFGLLLDRPAAILLTEKVRALKEQAIKKLGDPALWTAELTALGIPPANVQALVSEWAAQAFKAPLPV